MLQWSGLYEVTNITSTFSGGKFTQLLTGNRLDTQEDTVEGNNSSTYNVTTNYLDTSNSGEGNLQTSEPDK